MPFIYSAFQVSNLTHLIKNTNLEDNLHNILNKTAINKFDLARLLSQLRKHHYGTYQHSLNVANLTYHLTKKMQLSKKEVIEISIGAILHDIGKVFIDQSILNKPGRLTNEEWKLIKKHPEWGRELLSRYDWAESMLPFVLYHHERVDGLGYLGLCNENIPLGAKIICLADSFDAMVSKRPYRKRLSIAQCLKEIKKNSGTQFAPVLASMLIRILEKTYLQSKTALK